MVLNNGTGFTLGFEVAILALVFIIAFIMFLGFIVNSFLPFKKERDYIKAEMARSYEEQEYEYWKKELKKLYLSCIPFFGKYFR